MSDAPALQPSPSVSSGPRGVPPATILLVEDNPDDEALALRALGRSGWRDRIVVKHDGQEALDYLLDRGGAAPPAVVLLDLKLPKLDGLEVLRALRADRRTRSQPVVILTSSREEQDLVASYDLGVNSYVRKPVDFVRFTATVGQLGTYWLALNERPPG